MHNLVTSILYHLNRSGNYVHHILAFNKHCISPTECSLWLSQWTAINTLNSMNQLVYVKGTHYIMRGRNCILQFYSDVLESRGGVVKALCCKPEDRGFQTRWSEWFFFNLPNPSGRTYPGVYSASNRNEYLKQKTMFPGIERGRCVGLNLAAICEPIV
jgi:hypothetical protein